MQLGRVLGGKEDSNAVIHLHFFVLCTFHIFIHSVERPLVHLHELYNKEMQFRIYFLTN